MSRQPSQPNWTGFFASGTVLEIPLSAAGARELDQLAKDHFRGDITAAHAALIAHRRRWPVITSEDHAAGFREVGPQVELLP